MCAPCLSALRTSTCHLGCYINPCTFTFLPLSPLNLTGQRSSQQTYVTSNEPAAAGHSTHNVHRMTDMQHSQCECDSQTDSVTSSSQHHRHHHHQQQQQQHSSSAALVSQLSHLHSTVYTSLTLTGNMLLYIRL